MPSFASLSVLATLAFGALSSALPLGAPAVPAVPGVDAVTHAAGLSRALVAAEGAAAGKGAAVVGGRDVAVRGLAAIFADVQVKLLPSIEKFNYCNAGNGTVETITPIVADIKVVLDATLVEVKGLVGQPLSVILCAVDGVTQLAVQDVATLLAGLLCFIFTGIGACLKVCVNVSVILPLLCTVGQLVYSILVVVFSLVAGLQVALCPLLGEITWIIAQLNISVLINILAVVAV